jgi:membrane-associated phospholipid phosphatase
MNQAQSVKKKPLESIIEIFRSLLEVVKSKYFYIGLLTLGIGGALNLASQTYLHNYANGGKVLPMLSDLILDNLPVLDVSLLYDLFCIVIFATVGIYIIHRKDYNRIPFILLLCGLFFIIRGIFVVLTPFGNPPEFNGSDALFNGFSRYELGVYPSGHVGNSFLLLLLVNDSKYRRIMWIWLSVIIISLFLAHGHYSIDILSGIFFAYAIRAYGNKHLTMFDLGNSSKVKVPSAYI